MNATSGINLIRTAAIAAAVAIAAGPGVAATVTPAAPLEAAAAVGDEPVTLIMATPYCDDDLADGTGSRYTPAVFEFTDNVRQLSGGTIEIDFVMEFCLADDGEQQVVDGVADGDFDLAWAGTRVFDTFDVTGFQAMHAPFLVDSYALQAAILDSDMPTTMLGSLDAIGVEGLSMLAGHLRRPIGREGPLLGPDDWAGITFQIYRSDVQAAAVEALGATPTDVVAGVRDAGLVTGEIDAHEHALAVYVVRNNAAYAPYVTVDVALWPEPIALLANPDALAALSAEQRDAVREAATAAAATSVDLIDVEDELVEVACELGAVLAEAGADNVDALRDAVEPVYDALRGDEETADLIDRIEELKASISTEPLVIPEGCGVGEAAAEPAEVSAALPPGNYRTEITAESAAAAAVAAGFDPDEAAEFAEDDFGDGLVFTILLTADGRWWEICSEGGGPEFVCWNVEYEVADDDTIVVTEQPEECTFTFGFILADDQLDLEYRDASCPDEPELGDDPGFVMFVTMLYEAAPFTVVVDDDQEQSPGTRRGPAVETAGPLRADCVSSASCHRSTWRRRHSSIQPTSTQLADEKPKAP